MTNKKIVLCIPHGGLNDTLCQIEFCRQYAIKFDRTLYLDTRKSGLLGDFSIFFKMLDSVGIQHISCSSDIDFAQLNKLSAFPSVLDGRLDSYDSYYSPTIRKIVERISDTPVTFNMDSEYVEDVLVHQQPGGGSKSFALLSHLTLSAPIKEEIRNRLAVLPEKYCAVHVRNTDYKSDYISFFEDIKETVSGTNLLICSDDAEVIAYAKNYFFNSKVFSITTTTLRDQKPLHRASAYKDDNMRILATLNALTDLIALAKSETLHFPKIGKLSASGESTLGTSGFSRLAEYLFLNKNLINSLM